MKTRHSVRTKILFSLPIIFSLIFIAVGMFLIYDFWISSDYMLFWSGAMFLWMGSGYLYVVTTNVKIFELHDRFLVIRKPFYKFRVEIELSKVKYTNFQEELTWNTRRGIMIKADNEILQIEIKEYSNSKDFIEYITKNCEKDDSIKMKIWTKQLAWFLSIGLIILVGSLITKVLSM